MHRVAGYRRFGCTVIVVRVNLLAAVEMNVESKFHFDTEYSADSIEFCPFDNDWFICGTYQLRDDELNDDPNAPKKRLGRYYLCRLDEQRQSFSVQQQDETAAILDIKW